MGFGVSGSRMVTPGLGVSSYLRDDRGDYYRGY